MCHTHRLTEAELTARIASNQRAAARAARQIIARAERGARAAQTAQAAQAPQQCPPCTGNCQQGDTCPALLKARQQAQADAAALRDEAAATARAKVEADALVAGLPVSKWALIGYLGVIAATVGLSHAFARGWI